MFLPTQHELLLQIIERPDDDALRLVLADRLNDVGDPLGELIHVQLGIERIQRGEAAGDWLALKRRERELVQQHGVSWQQQAAPFARKLTMKRGLPHALSCSLDALLKDGGLTVLAPIRQLELDRVDAEELSWLLALPLIRRLDTLIIGGLRGFALVRRMPPPLPPSIKRFVVGLDSDEAFDHALTMGLLDHVEELELLARWLSVEAPIMMRPPVLPALKKVTFSRVHDRHYDSTWLPGLKDLLAHRPGLKLVWRGIEYDAGNLESLLAPLEPQFMDDPVMRPANIYNREPFGPVREGALIDTGGKSYVHLERLDDQGLVAISTVRADVDDVMQPLSLDACVHLQLPRMEGVLTALSFQMEGDVMMLRYEVWPCRTLHEVGLPLPAPVALRVVYEVAGAIIELRAALRTLGVPGWPRALSRDSVLLGEDGRVRLLPPFANTLLVEPRPLGLPVDNELEGTDDGVLQLLGTGLMHLLLGDTAVSRRLRPSGLNPSLEPLDALVEGCLSTRRSGLFGSLHVFLEKLNGLGLMSSQDAVAQHLKAEQSSKP